MRDMRFLWMASISVSNRQSSLLHAAIFSGWLARPPPTCRIAGSMHNRLSIVHILVAGQPAVDRLPNEWQQGMTGAADGAGVLQPLPCRYRESQRLVEFSIRKQTNVAGYLAPHERHPHSPVEIDMQITLLAVTPWFPPQKSMNWQEIPDLQGHSADPVPTGKGHLGNVGVRFKSKVDREERLPSQRDSGHNSTC